MSRQGLRLKSINLLNCLKNYLDNSAVICSADQTVLEFLKFIYSEKATKFCEISPLLLTVCTVVKSKGEISQNFVAFSEYINFNEKS